MMQRYVCMYIHRQYVCFSRLVGTQPFPQRILRTSRVHSLRFMTLGINEIPLNRILI